jgi:hypothetical protein
VTIQATPVGMGSIAPDRRALTGGYRYQGDDDGGAPREIVARLHKVIAAKSPAHAALVARWEQKQAARASDIHPQVTACRERMERYGELREDGMPPEEAAGEFGLQGSTAQRYEAYYKAARREDGGLVFPWQEQEA